MAWDQVLGRMAWVVCLALLAPSTVHPAPIFDQKDMEREEVWLVAGEHVEEQLVTGGEGAYDYGSIDWERTSLDSPKFLRNFKLKAEAVMGAVGNASKGGRVGATSSSLALNITDLGELVGRETGRHLLLVTLLEAPGTPAWEARCSGRLRLFLPASLRAPEQPLEVPQGALVLGEVVEEGRVVTREQVAARFTALVPPELTGCEKATFSFYNFRHRAAVREVVDWLVDLAFPTALSLLVTLHGLAAPDLLLEVVTRVILGRKDCGLAIPDRASVMPALFFPLEEEEHHHHRQKRQASVDWTRRNDLGDPGYFREDPRLNSHHAHWHTVNRGGRGGVFAYMHQQMLNRYNAERLSMGLGLSVPLGPQEWRKPIRTGYDPGMAGYVARVPGGVMGNNGHYADFLQRIDARAFGGYRDGMDQGVVQLGNALEPGLHDWAHKRLGKMVARRGGDEAAIGTTSGSARDPIFYRWHALVESIFTRYKETLGPYTATDLAFPGVAVERATIRQQGRPDNSLETALVTSEVEVASLKRPTSGTQSFRLWYRSMAHQ